jgi:hypothetical protein
MIMIIAFCHFKSVQSVQFNFTNQIYAALTLSSKCLIIAFYDNPNYLETLLKRRYATERVIIISPNIYMSYLDI